LISNLANSTGAPQKLLCRWPRALARLLDLAWELALVIPLIIWFAEKLKPASISSTLWLLAITFVSIPLAMLLDAIVAGVFGNTPVKALVGIKPRTVGMDRIGLYQHIRRNFAVWTEGMAIGILPLTLLSGRTQFRRINGRRSTTYDQRLGVHVRSSPNSGLRISALFAALLAPFLIAQVYFGDTEKNTADSATAADTKAETASAKKAVVAINSSDARTQAPLDTTPNSSDTDALIASTAEIEKPVQAGTQTTKDKNATASIAWTNPLSGLSTEVSAQFDIVRTDDGDLLALFSHQPSDTTVELEKIEAGTIIDQKQIPEYLEKTLSNIDFRDPWIDFEFADLQIFESSGVGKELNVPVSIQATLHSGGSAPLGVIIMMKGKNYTSEAS